jgi:hypothetical protein
VGPHRRVAALDTVIAAAGGYLLQIGAGAEGAAAAGQDGNRARRVAVEAAKGGSQRLIRGAIDGIARLREFDGDDGYAIIDFVGDGRGFRHCRDFLSSELERSNTTARLADCRHNRCLSAWR